MTNPVPSLSSSGWVSELAEKVDRILAYFFVSDHSQSLLYAGNVTSLAYLVQQFGNDDLRITTEVQTQLSRLLERYFEAASVTVDVDHPVEGDESRLNIRVDATVIDGKYKHSIGKLISTVNSRVVEIMTINNG